MIRGNILKQYQHQTVFPSFERLTRVKNKITIIPQKKDIPLDVGVLIYFPGDLIFLIDAK